MKNYALSVYRRVNADRLCYLFLIFMTGCLIGWVYEEIFYWITEGILRNRGLLYGPWLPIYGVGALGIYAMKPLKKNPVLLFFMCVAVTGVVEYIIGLIGIRFFGIRLWDYRGLFMNIGGIICLRSLLSFAVMGMIFHYLLEPTAEKFIKKINPNKVHTACLFLLLVLLLDCFLSAMFRTPITYRG